MTKTYLLIDLQNRQPAPARVAAWMGDAGEAWIFYGENEIKLLPRYWELGEQISIVPISRPGKNSLDFHLILYLGWLVARREKGARFVIVAEDTDYDPAITHAQGVGIDVVRLPELPLEAPIDGQAIAVATLPVTAKRVVEISHQSGGTLAEANAPAARNISKRRTKTASEIYTGILTDIRGANRPGDFTALSSRIQSRIGHQTAPEKVAAVLDRLETMDVIKVVDNVLTYLANADKKTPPEPGSPVTRSTAPESH